VKNHPLGHYIHFINPPPVFITVSENWHLRRSNELGHLIGQGEIWNAYTIVARTFFFGAERLPGRLRRKQEYGSHGDDCDK
jgi:hypothetical protein